MKLDKEKYRKHTFIADGMMSLHSIGEGRFIPCLIFEQNTSPEIAELCKIHKNSPPGDIETVWVRPFTFSNPKVLVLKIQFKKPMELTFGILFNLLKHYSLIDGIVNSQMLQIETGELGDKVSDLKNDRILIEVHKSSMSNKWQMYLEETLKKKYREKNVPKNQISKLVTQHINSMRQIWNIRK